MRVIVSRSASVKSFHVHLDGELLCTSRTPFFSAARVLLVRGVSPDAVLEMAWGVDAPWSLRASVGTAAKLSVRETDRHGPYLCKYQAPSWDRSP